MMHNTEESYHPVDFIKEIIKDTSMQVAKVAFVHIACSEKCCIVNYYLLSDPTKTNTRTNTQIIINMPTTITNVTCVF